MQVFLLHDNMSAVDYKKIWANKSILSTQNNNERISQILSSRNVGTLFIINSRLVYAKFASLITMVHVRQNVTQRVSYFSSRISVSLCPSKCPFCAILYQIFVCLGKENIDLSIAKWGFTISIRLFKYILMMMFSYKIKVNIDN